MDLKETFLAKTRVSLTASVVVKNKMKRNNVIVKLQRENRIENATRRISF